MLQWNPWKRVWGGWSLKSVQTQTILLFCVNGSESSCGSQWIKAWSHLWDNLCPVGLDLTITPHSQRLGEDGAGVWWSSSNVTSHPLRASRTSSDAFRALDIGLHKFPSIKNKSRWMVLVSRKKNDSEERLWQEQKSTIIFQDRPESVQWRSDYFAKGFQNSSLMYLKESQKGHVCFTSFSFYPHFILMTRENGKNANEWMPSLICVVPEHNLVTWQASGTSGIAAHKQEGTSAPLQAVSQFSCWFEGSNSQESPLPLQNRGAEPTVGLFTCCSHHGDSSFNQE